MNGREEAHKDDYKNDYLTDVIVSTRYQNTFTAALYLCLWVVEIWISLAYSKNLCATFLIVYFVLNLNKTCIQTVLQINIFKLLDFHSVNII